MAKKRAERGADDKAPENEGGGPDLTDEMERDQDQMREAPAGEETGEESPPRLDPRKAAAAREQIEREAGRGAAPSEAPGTPEGDPPGRAAQEGTESLDVPTGAVQAPPRGEAKAQAPQGAPVIADRNPEEEQRAEETRGQAGSALEAQTTEAENIPTLARDDAALRESRSSGDPAKAPGQPLQDDPNRTPSPEETAQNVAILNSPKGDLAPMPPSQNLEATRGAAPEPRKGERYFHVLRGVVQGFVAAPAGAPRQTVSATELNLPEAAIERLKTMGSLQELDPRG